MSTRDTIYGPVRLHKTFISYKDYTEAELRVELDDAECEYAWWNIASRVRQEMSRRGLEAPPEARGLRPRPAPASTRKQP